VDATPNPASIVAVWLADSLGATVDSAMVGIERTFLLRAPREGLFMLHARLLGYRPVQAPLRLVASPSQLMHDVTLLRLPHDLAGVRVIDNARCSVPEQDRSRVLELLELLDRFGRA
jgi:hypothetical protein